MAEFQVRCDIIDEIAYLQLPTALLTDLQDRLFCAPEDLWGLSALHSVIAEAAENEALAKGKSEG